MSKKLLKLEKVTKQKAGFMLLKNTSIEVEEASRVGIRCSSLESQVLLDLIEGKESVTSGEIEHNFDCILSERLTDELYESFSVKQYLKVFHDISGKKADFNQLKKDFGLVDSWNTRIKKLTLAQKKRVHLLRAYLLNADLLMVESSIAELDDEGIRLYLKCLDILSEAGVTLILTGVYLEELILTNGDIYSFEEQGLEKIEMRREQESNRAVTDDALTTFQTDIFKISCKVDDKIVLFNPNEIDYVESINSISQVHVNQEIFPSALTMNELEEKLTKFGFFRCHRSYMVNLQRVRELISYSKNSYTLILGNGAKSKLPLSRSRLEELKRLLEI